MTDDLWCMWLQTMDEEGINIDETIRQLEDDKGKDEFQHPEDQTWLQNSIDYLRHQKKMHS